MAHSLRSILMMVCGLACLLAMALGGIVGIAQRSRQTPEKLRWLVDAGCTFPCWRGITPSQTRFLEASRILREQPDVKLTGIENSGGYNLQIVRFEVRTPQGILRGEMTSNENSTSVLYIYFYAINAEGDGWLRLADLITLVGSPIALMQDTKGGSMVRLNFGNRHFEAVNFPWLLYPQNHRSCQRWDTQVGLYLGDDPNFEAWERWRGFDGQFDRWCNVSP